MLVLHQALPHVHHQHNGLEDSIGQTEQQLHSHEKEHHQKAEGDVDFIDFLLVSHSHGVHAENIPIGKTNAKPFVAVNHTPVFTIYVAQELSITNSEPEKTICRQHPPDYFYHNYLSASSLRGPPSLG